MSTAATALSTIAGATLIGVAGRDIFDALFHPEGRGTFARVVSRALWRLFRRSSGRTLSLAGPMILVAVIGTWAVLLVVGWTLVFWPHMPEGFRFGAGVGEDGSDLVDALNLSLVTLTTLGYGDVTPDAAWLRIITPFEALLGFGLLSASISWLLLIYPVLARRRSLAYEVTLIREEEQDAGEPFDRTDPDAAERLYAELTSRLIAVERDLVNFPITYYFAEADDRFSLPRVAPYLLELAERGVAEDQPRKVRLRARLLREAVHDLARTTSERFHRVREDDTASALRAFARDHARRG